MTKRRILLFQLTILVMGIAGAGRIRAADLLQTAEATFRNDNFEYEYKSAAVHLQDLWVVVGLRPRGQTEVPQQFHMWKVDSQGKSLNQINVSAISPSNHPQEKYSHLHDLVTLKDGKLALLAETGKETDLLIFDGNSGQLLTNRPLTLTGSSPYINKTFGSPDGTVTVVGRLGARPLLLKLQSSGKIASQVTVQDKEVEVFVDAVELTDRTFMLLGEHLSGTGQIITWIGHVTAGGDILYSSTFSGHDGSISCDADGHNCTVVYASAGTGGWNISIRTFAENRLSADQINLFSGIRTNSKFRLAMGADESVFVIGANAKNRLWMARINRSGKILTSLTFEEQATKWQRVWNYGLLTTAHDFIVPFTEFVVGNEMEQREIVKILWLRPS